jgi:hypothetical protein
MVSVIIASLVVIALYVGTKRLSGLETLAVAVIAIAGISLAVFPQLSTRIANLLHVGRGTDLVFYFAVLAGLFVASNFYFRFKRHEEALIALARQNAIARAQPPPPTSAPESGPEGDRAVQ